MFKTQIDNHNFRKNVATDRKYILRKMSLKFRNFKSDFSCKIPFYIFFVINWNSLEWTGQWGIGISSWINLYALISEKTETIHKIGSQNSYTQNCPQKHYNKYSYQICLSLVVYHHHLQNIFYKRASHWWFIGGNDIFILVYIRLIVFLFSQW